MAATRRIVALSELAAGAVDELFHHAMKDALDNIQDPNTDWKKPRKITMTVEIAPNEARIAANVKIDVATKFPGVKPVDTVLYLGRHEGLNSAVEAAPQSDMFKEPTGRPRAVVDGAHVS